MSHFRTCSHGHRWEWPSDTPLPGTAEEVVCPVCAESDAAGASEAPSATVPMGPKSDRARERPRLEGYEVLGELGRGGMGVVYKARQQRPSRVVALKMILAGPHADAHLLSRFRAEADAVARLRHPNVIQIYEVGEQDGRPYFSMEYADGGSLAGRLAGGPLPARSAAELVEVLARAVHAAHGQGVVHRDLKPANILLQKKSGARSQESEGSREPARASLPSDSWLLTPDSFPKIADFGLARQLDGDGSDTCSGAVVGTPSYMAPEQAQGKSRQSGPAVDVYALGAILYETVTGRPPFRAATTLDTLEQVRTQEPIPPGRLQPGLPRDLETICLKCLRKEPRQRYASAEELANDLRRFLAGEPVRARPVSGGERLLKWARRRPAAAALAAVCALAVTGLVAGVAAHNVRLQREIGRAETNETRALKQQRRADTNYREARAALNRMMARLDSKSMAGVPRLRELRRQLLQDALPFYQNILAHEDDPDPAVRFDVAMAYRECAALQYELDDAAAAEAGYRRAVELLDALVAERPDVLEYQAELDRCCHNLGVQLSGEPGRQSEAEQWLRKALAISQRLSRAHPDISRWRYSLALTHFSLGNLCWQQAERLEETEALYDEARRLYEQVCRDEPANSHYQVSLARTYIMLGSLYNRTQRPKKAGAVFALAAPILQALVERHPEELDFAVALAGLHANWGNLVWESYRQPDRAAALFTQAIEAMEKLLRQEPQYSAARQPLLHAHGMRAYVYSSLGRHAESVKDWDRVVELIPDGPERYLRRSEHAAEIARAGDHARAAAAAEALLKDPKATLDSRYNAACTLSLCITAANRDARLSPGEQSSLAERYAARCVEVLRRLQADGFFAQARGPWLLKVMQEERDFTPLQKRADYQQLIGELKEKK